jgi:hypothetical protein
VADVTAQTTNDSDSESSLATAGDMAAPLSMEQSVHAGHELSLLDGLSAAPLVSRYASWYQTAADKRLPAMESEAAREHLSAETRRAAEQLSAGQPRARGLGAFA